MLSILKQLGVLSSGGTARNSTCWPLTELAGQASVSWCCQFEAGPRTASDQSPGAIPVECLDCTWSGQPLQSPIDND